MSAPYQIMPPLAPVEMAELRASIEMSGVQVKIIIDEFGAIIDGHHRKQIVDELGIECPSDVRERLSEEQKRTLARSLNTARRMLTREQIRALIAGQLADTPHVSDRKIADALHVDHKTVGAERKAQVELGKIPQSDKRQGSDGKTRKQPVKKRTRQPLSGQRMPSAERSGPLRLTFDQWIENYAAQEAIRKAADAMIPERIEIYRELSEKATNTIKEYSARAKGLHHLMTLEEYRLVLGCLHPDRAASVDAERLNKAFVIFRRLVSTIDPKTPIDDLRRNGWEVVSSRHRPSKKTAADKSEATS
jgi:ParB-like chromosome segregation protein Spo0J